MVKERSHVETAGGNFPEYNYFSVEVVDRFVDFRFNVPDGEPVDPKFRDGVFAYAKVMITVIASERVVVLQS